MDYPTISSNRYGPDANSGTQPEMPPEARLPIDSSLGTEREHPSDRPENGIGRPAGEKRTKNTRRSCRNIGFLCEANRRKIFFVYDDVKGRFIIKQSPVKLRFQDPHETRFQEQRLKFRWGSDNR